MKQRLEQLRLILSRVLFGERREADVVASHFSDHCDYVDDEPMIFDPAEVPAARKYMAHMLRDIRR